MKHGGFISYNSATVQYASLSLADLGLVQCRHLVVLYCLDFSLLATIEALVDAVFLQQCEDLFRMTLGDTL